MDTKQDTRRFLWLPVVIALIQIFDIAIHLAGDMIEPIRILSNVVIFVWIGLVVTDRAGLHPWRTAGGFLGVYLLLNAVFVATEGFINPVNNQFRTVLIILVGLTVTLSILFTDNLVKSKGQNKKLNQSN